MGGCVWADLGCTVILFTGWGLHNSVGSGFCWTVCEGGPRIGRKLLGGVVFLFLAYLINLQILIVFFFPQSFYFPFQ